ncbi:response regulator transcription factor [Fusibacter ferrireducens]|uniref:Stage 0 sporulation protein A homolog n=1 Tax=Fusibacter ferrireducens TaxID=2785058 RepID=A0ABR9ZXV6_9FIRM|nr:response regulator transcription factor [Fusibacter ferrireducens]MBF4694399.1 response regulator transcription factor [Fusibacter ferrireducens]
MKILIVDDEKNIRRLLKDFLSNEGYEVIEAADGFSGIDQTIAHRDIDLILLDVRMPKLNGYETLESMREITDAPVIFLTAMDGAYDEVKGLDLGAEDYITKPFQYEVLMARIKKCLKRSPKFDKEQLNSNQINLRLKEKKAYIEGVDIEVTNKEFELLEYLIINKNITIQRQTLLDRIWGYDYEQDPRTVDTHVKTLRAKLGACSGCIKTVRGVGYRFDEA